MIKSRRKWVGYVACTGAIRNTYQNVFGKPEGDRPLRRPRHTWKDNIKMDLIAVHVDGVRIRL
jgi:hypothetical protein